MSGKYKYLFGPVPSRRLGRSLGIDVTPFKTCSFDCVFCQLGCTTHLATERGEFVPFDEVCAELERWLAEDGRADYITFAGSGEPTLYSRLGELIDFIKARTEIPVIVLSNGTLLYQPAVREQLLNADIVKVSLSAWDEASFQRINRPAPGLCFELLLSGESDFRAEFGGQLWLEAFLMEGINAAPEQVRQIAAAVATVRPDRIQLNTAVRPPAEVTARPVAAETLEALCECFEPRAEAVTSFDAAPVSGTGELSSDGLVGLIHRHPATAEQLAAISGADVAAIRAALAPFLEVGRIQVEVRDGDTYYK
ncbi:MAG: radical SAM protein [Verrucomicrobia bacterium]|nr:radical SAM protein [Verrucomicrobiota bacterium]